MQNDELLSLLSATAQGDRQAFAKLYQRTSHRLYAVSLTLLKRKDLAEEALQEAYIRIWHNADQYQQAQGNVLTWMISIVRYRALDMLRYAKVRKEQDLDDIDIEDEPTWQGTTWTSIERQQLDHCMAELNSEQRQAIHLAYFFGLTHSEVVDHMNLPLGTIKSWIRRGLQSLQRCLTL